MSDASIATASPREPRRWFRAAVDVSAVAGAVGYTASFFPLALLLAPTVTNGGDMGSHYYPAAYLRETLLPLEQLLGWCPGSYAGYPLFQIYFPAPFLLMAALSVVVPLTVAFKLTTILGTVLLPVCAYASLHLMRAPFPGPATGSIATLFFLFMEANSMWGGNVPSTLAGEFPFSMSFALALLFLGTLRRTMETGRGRVGNAGLVALIGLCHGYPLLWAGLVSTLELVTTRAWWRRLGTLVVVHGLAILLMAFWLVPLLGYTPWTTSFNATWLIGSWHEVLPPILWPPALVAVLAAVGLGVLSLWRRQTYPRDVAIWWGAIGISAFFYGTAPAFHVVDIRFLPFLQISLCLAAAAGLGRLLALAPAAEVWPFVVALATLPFVQSQVDFIPGWIRWNYSGFEAKTLWPVFRDVNRHLAGDFRAPRVAYEHSSDHEALGTSRAFENLPFFSGRSTLEGLYLQSSPTAPFVFYLQSEISKESSCPLPQWGCTRFDLDHGIEHLRMFNVSQFIVRSSEAKEAASRHPGLTREVVVGPYEIYAVRGNDGRYAIPLSLAPVLVRDRAWKEAAYQWFKQATTRDPVAVFAEEVSSDELRSFSGDFSELPRELPRSPLADPPALVERFETNRLTLTGCRPGHPVLVRISYHPRWRAVTGERIWLATPSFMLVVPKGERVELVFEAGPLLGFGRACTALGVVLAIVGSIPIGRRLASRAGRSLAETAPLNRGVELLRRTGRWSDRARRTLLGSGLALVGVVLAAFVTTTRSSDADTFYREGQQLLYAGHLRESLPYFEQVQRLAPLSSTAHHARFFEALVYFREEEWREAEERFLRLTEGFPEAPNAPEALYHVGLCREQLGNLAGAVAVWREAARRFPDVEWGRLAGKRAAEVGNAAREP